MPPTPSTHPDVTHFAVDRLQVFIHPDRNAMGRAASEQAAQVLRAAIQAQGRARIIVASAPSQDELIAGLAVAPGIDWSRVTVFHMDEYVGLAASHSASFRHYQQQHLLAKVRPAAFHGIRGEAPDPAAECRRYAALLAAAPIDLVCLGIGENGHIAFNDPAVADFDDPQAVKIVELDAACRQQQVNDGCFADIGAVPRQAITLTCPALLSGRVLVGVVPGARKAAAVDSALCGAVGTACPATILRRHASATLHLDDAAAGLLRQRLAASQPSQAGRAR
ncbi:MAG: glucosamine-6-phosphate deaminase [Betaproteobacteria bacterium]|jgi:glucosamine-6-phosphate deaminase|nr:glucosamine-6-phosphate deaminase [Betaproteobacteria bacterium]